MKNQTQETAPFTIQISREGEALSTVQLTERQSGRLAEFAQKNDRTLAEMAAFAVSVLTEEISDSYEVPKSILEEDDMERALRLQDDEDEREE
jgi:hypothetical protein